MSVPGSSGKAGPTPIPDEPKKFVGEQVRPSFYVGTHELRLGDRIIGYHRVRKHEVDGTVIVLVGCVCISTSHGIFPVDRIAILTVQPPLFE